MAGGSSGSGAVGPKADWRERRGEVLFIVNGGEKVGHVAAQNQASGAARSAMARALVT